MSRSGPETPLAQKRIYVLGAGGQLGREMLRATPPAGLGLRGFSRQELDVTDPAALMAAIGAADCALVVNCAAYTAVDKAESDVQASFAVNVGGVAAMARACDEAAVPLVHVSTEYIFDGRKNGPYVEADQPSPLNAYGQGKAEAERHVRLLAKRHVILRTSWLFSAHGHNFVKTILRLAQSHERLRVVVDQIGCPTPARDMAEAIMHIAGQLLAGKQDGFGTFHYCGAGPVSRLEFARAIVEQARPHLGETPEIAPTSQSAFPTPAARPANCVLDCAKIVKAYGLAQKSWEPGLADVITELYAKAAGEGSAAAAKMKGDI